MRNFTLVIHDLYIAVATFHRFLLQSLNRWEYLVFGLFDFFLEFLDQLHRLFQMGTVFFNKAINTHRVDLVGIHNRVEHLLLCFLNDFVRQVNFFCFLFFLFFCPFFKQYVRPADHDNGHSHKNKNHKLAADGNDPGNEGGYTKGHQRSHKPAANNGENTRNPVNRTFAVPGPVSQRGTHRHHKGNVSGGKW